MFRKMTTVLLASLALALPLAMTTRAGAEGTREMVALAPRFSVLGYPPGSDDEQLYGRYNSRSRAEDAASDAADRGWTGVRIHRHR